MTTTVILPPTEEVVVFIPQIAEAPVLVADLPLTQVILFDDGDEVIPPSAPPQIVILETQAVQQVILAPKDTIVILGTEGPPGKPGDTGGAASSILTATAASNLGGHRVVKTVGMDEVDYADSSVPGDADLVVGVTLGAATAGADVQVQTDGVIEEGSWTWTPGPVWLGLTGILTQTPPTSGFLCKVGIALGPTTLLVDVEPAIVLAS